MKINHQDLSSSLLPSAATPYLLLRWQILSNLGSIINLLSKLCIRSSKHHPEALEGPAKISKNNREEAQMMKNRDKSKLQLMLLLVKRLLTRHLEEAAIMKKMNQQRLLDFQRNCIRRNKLRNKKMTEELSMKYLILPMLTKKKINRTMTLILTKNLIFNPKIKSQIY